MAEISIALRGRAVVSETRHLLFSVMPGAVWIIVFLVLPSVYLMAVAFMTNGPYGLPQMLRISIGTKEEMEICLQTIKDFVNA